MLVLPLALWIAIGTQEAPAAIVERLEPGRGLTGEVTDADGEITSDALGARFLEAPVVGRSIEVRVDEAGLYTLDLRSQFFDAYLVLRDASGTVLCEDDDGGVWRHARLVQRFAPDESYRVDVCALHGQRGPFELTLARRAPVELTPAQQRELELADAEEGVAAVRARHGEDSDVLARAYNRLGTVHYRQGDYDAARGAYERAIDIRARALGEDEPTLTILLNNQALLLKELGEFAEARELFERSLAVCEKALGPDHPYTASSQGNLAELLREVGEGARAEELYGKSLATFERHFGSEHRWVAGSLNNLASAVSDRGAFDEARPLFERAVAIFERVQGPAHPDTAQAVANLAALLLEMDFHDEALKLYERVIQLSERALGPEHPDMALRLHNMAMLQSNLGHLDEARTLYERALAITEKSFGPEHGVTAGMQRNLASLFEDLGREEEALALLERSLAVARRFHGPEHPTVALHLDSLGVRLARMQRFEEALALFDQALAISAKTATPYDPNLAVQRKNRAWALLELGEHARARADYERTLEASERHLTRVQWSLAERERLLYAHKMGQALAALLSFRDPERSGLTAREAHARVLRWKGRVSRGLVASRERLAASGGARSAELLYELRSVQAGLSELLLGGDANPHVARIEGLQERKETLERELARLTGPLVDATPGYDEIRAALPSHAAAVDFLVHSVYEPGHRDEQGRLVPGDWRPHRLSAWVVHGERTTWLDLGPAEPIQAAVGEFLRGVSDSASRLDRGVGLAVGPQGQGGGARLDELIWGALRPHVGDAELIVVSPDSFLGTVPFEVMRDEGGRFLIEGRAFVYLQDLSVLTQWAAGGTDARTPADEAPPSLLAVGGIDYDARPVESTRLRSSGASWSALPGTLRESRAVAELHESVFGEEAARSLLDGKEAREDHLRSELERYSVVHLATHGFFQPDWLPAFDPAHDETPLLEGMNARGREPRSAARLLPGFLSGLVCAGANADALPGEDGLLTAEEIAWLDLSALDLIVLSACETGLGRPKSGEGLLGLRRSLRQAGARTVISSLWRVSDEATAELMGHFYANLWKRKATVLTALRQAQLTLLAANRERYGEALPGTWGAFVLDGDWR
jgi:CHAT domain-containing protein/tetratricopeptide (TPR) repeat protein